MKTKKKVKVHWDFCCENLDRHQSMRLKWLPQCEFLYAWCPAYNTVVSFRGPKLKYLKMNKGKGSPPYTNQINIPINGKKKTCYQSVLMDWYGGKRDSI